jgi:hypothetical protein
MPKGSFSVRCCPEFRNWPREDDTGFLPIPTLHLIGVNTNAVIRESLQDLRSLLNTNEVYDFTVSRYKRTIKLNSGETASCSMKGFKVIMIEQNGKTIYKDFNDIIEDD